MTSSTNGLPALPWLVTVAATAVPPAGRMSTSCSSGPSYVSACATWIFAFVGTPTVPSAGRMSTTLMVGGYEQPSARGGRAASAATATSRQGAARRMDRYGIGSVPTSGGTGSQRK